jgi:Protein of unknown function (DUF3313)
VARSAKTHRNIRSIVQCTIEGWPRSLAVGSLALCLVALAGCESVKPTDYSSIASAPMMTPNTADRTGKIPFIYTAADVDFSKYQAVIVDPAAIYTGQDNRFGKVSATNRETLALYMQAQFTRELATKFVVRSEPGAGVLRVHLTLTGAEATVPVIAPLTRVMPPGAVLNTLQGARGKQGALMGSVSYAVEVYDSRSGALLRAYISKQFPFAEDVTSSFGVMDASKAGLRMGAADLLAQLR